jgi:hypothetical protein
LYAEMVSSRLTKVLGTRSKEVLRRV